MSEHLPFLFLAALIVGMSKGGLSSAGSLAVPMLAIWVDPLTAAAFLLPVYIISDAAAVWLYRHSFSSRNLAILIPAGLAGVALATIVAPLVPVAVIIVATGLIGLAYCIKAWFLTPHDAPARPADIGRGALWGLVTGLTSFVSHSGAPPFQAYVLPQKLPKLVYAGTTTFVFAAINLSKLPAYMELGLMDGLDWRLIAVLCVAAVAGAWLGRRIAILLPEKIYLQVLQTLLFLLSIRLLWDGGNALARMI